MNLKDRMKSEIPNQASQESKTVQEMSETIENQKIQIQQLSSEKSELTSVIADLRAELSSVQKINQSLTTNNQLLVKQNDDLRNNAGLLSKKEQKQLEERCRTLTDGNAELKRQVNISNVEAVESARAAQKAAERKAEKDISDYRKAADKKVSEAVNDKNTAVRKAKEAVKSAKNNQSIAWGSLLITLLCCMIAYQTFLWDVWYFISIPFVWLWDKLSDYSVWLSKPYYTKTVSGIEKKYAFTTGWAWTLRILTIILILACIAGICFGIYRLFMYYKKRWCNLSLKVLLASLAAIIVFGEGIRKYVNINLVLLLVIIQVLYLGVLIYFDGYYNARNRAGDWEKIQNA